MDISERLKTVKKRISMAAQGVGTSPDDIVLVGVSKGIEREKILEGIRAGVKILGENYIQEACKKIESIKDAARWHFVGHLQKNKVNLAVKFFELIHSVDSFLLAEKINKEAEKLQKIQDVLIQVNIEKEKTKHGIEIEALENFFGTIQHFKNLRICGLMAIPPWYENPEKNRKNFSCLRQLKEKIDRLRPQNWEGRYLSMGMSDDFEIAIQEGSNMVRIGRLIFGERR